ncbi:MAG: ABC transporter substrate-binding protein [Thermomicrobiales bacterium]
MDHPLIRFAPKRVRLDRRALLAHSVIAGAASATFAAPVVLRAAAAQDSTPAAKVSGDLVEWGFGTAETNPLARSRVEAFQKAYPDVKLQVVESFDEQKLLTAAASDTVPDVIWLSRFETATWAARGVLQPLTPFIERDGYDTSNFYEAAIEESTWDGQLYGIPGGMDVRALFFNLDQLKEAGIDSASIDTSDWDALSEMGAKLVQKDGDVLKRWGFDHKYQAKNFWLWGNGNGGHFMNDDATEATFNDGKNVEALDWGVKAYDAQGGYQAYQGLSTTWQGDEQFPRGQVAITLYEQWMMGGPIATVAPDMNFTVLPVRERGSGPDGPMVSFTGGNSWYIPKGAKNPDAAWEFIKFLHSDATWKLGAEATKAYRDQQGKPYLPALTGSRTADQLQIDELYEPIAGPFDAAVKLFPQILEQSRNREIGKSPVAGQLEDIMADSGVSPALSGNASAQDALDQANSDAQDAIDSF